LNLVIRRCQNEAVCQIPGGFLITSPNQPQAPQLSGKRVVVVLYSDYPSDPRPRRAAEALAKEGAVVEMICLRERNDQPRREIFNGVDVTRVPLRRRRAGKMSYLVQYGVFILAAGAILTYRSFQRRFDLVHVHNMPDVLVFSALIPKLVGSKIILDLHDPMPELMMSIFGLREKSYAVRLLKMLEKLSLSFADAVMTVNEACRKIFASRSCSGEKLTVIMNSPDEEIFRFHEASIPAVSPPDLSKPFILMYHGALVERHGLDLAVQALVEVRKSIPKAELRIFGNKTPFLEHVLRLVEDLGLKEEAIRYVGPKNLEQIAYAISQCDVGIIPNRKSIFTQLNTPTRIFEFLSQGKPVIVPRAPGILDYFGPEELVMFELGDAKDLASKIDFAFWHPAEVALMVERAQQVYRAHKWSTERIRFLRLVKALLKTDRSSTNPARERALALLDSEK
jgi:glycosyltransferase involved in cell wall biosynthesis